MIADAQIFIPTFSRDLAWLECCLRSIRKYWRSSFPCVIWANVDCRGRLPNLVEELQCKVRFVESWSDGRRDQIYSKMMTDTFEEITSSLVLFVDSDCLFTMPTVTADLCTPEGKPFVSTKTYEEILALNLQETERWAYHGYQNAVQDVLTGRPVVNEYMQVQPFLYYKSTIEKTRSLIEGRMRKTLQTVSTSYHSSQFSEFNFFGACAQFYEPERYDFLPPPEWPERRIRVYHSWSMSPDSERASVEEILK